MKDDEKILEALVSNLTMLGCKLSVDDMNRLFSNVITKIDPQDFSTLFVNKYLASLGKPVIPANVPSLATSILQEVDHTDKGMVVLYKLSTGYTKLGILLEKQLAETDEAIDSTLDVDDTSKYSFDFKVLTMTGLVTEIVTVNSVDLIKILW